MAFDINKIKNKLHLYLTHIKAMQFYPVAIIIECLA